MSINKITQKDKIKVIILDDDETICKLLREVLEPIEWVEVVTVNNPRDFWNIYKYGEVGGVLLDLNLEGNIDIGIDIAEKLRSIDSNVFIFVITGYHEVVSNNKLLNSGIDDILLKPFDIQILKNRLFLMFSRLRRWENMRNLVNVNSKYYEERLNHLRDLMNIIKRKVNNNDVDLLPFKDRENNGTVEEQNIFC